MGSLYNSKPQSVSTPSGDAKIQPLTKPSSSVSNRLMFFLAMVFTVLVMFWWVWRGSKQFQATGRVIRGGNVSATSSHPNAVVMSPNTVHALKGLAHRFRSLDTETA